MSSTLGRPGTGAVAVSLTLCLVSAAAVLIDHPVGELRYYLNVGKEANLPTWWSTVLLLTAALVHGLAGLAAAAARVPARMAWFTSAALLALLSLAEHTGLHRRLGGLGRRLAGGPPGLTDWLPLGTVVAGLVVVPMLLLLAGRLRGRAGALLGIGGSMLLGCALGGELAGRLLAPEPAGWLYVLMYHAAELGENVGAAMLLAAATSVLRLTREETVLRLHYRTGPVAARVVAP